MEDVHKISSIVSKTLYITEQGVSNKIANLHKNIVHCNTMFSTARNEMCQIHCGGSYAEGLNCPGSDYDMMMVIPNILVCSNGKKRIHRNTNIFRMDSTKCRAGFFTLVLKQLDSSENDLFQVFGKDIIVMLEKDKEVNLLSSEKILQFSVAVSKRFAPNAFNYSQHGPAAATRTEVYSHGFMAGKGFLEFDIDFCFGVRYDGWPTEADEWVTRQRKYNWPQKDLIEKIRSLDCHLVPVGDKTSQNSHLEWRLSFLLCERELVWSFNDIQIQLYFLLKVLLKSELEQLYQDQLSSYCLKTAVFWYSESHDLNEWNEYNLLGLVKDCLLFILSFIKNGELQHYFDRNINLLYTKFADIERKQRFIEKIKELSKNVIQAVINLLYQEDVSKAWSKSNGDPKTFLLLCDDVDFLVTSFHKRRYLHDQLYTYKGISIVFYSIVIFDFDTLWFIWKYVSTNKYDGIDDDFLNSVRKFLTLRVGVCISEALKKLNEDDYERIFIRAERAILSAIDIDRISGYLYLATFYLYINKLNLAIHTLARVLKTNEETILIYPGECSTHEGIGMTSSNMLFQTEGPFLTGNIKTSACVGFDLMFSSTDILFVPDPVKYECALVQLVPEGLIIIHPVIYAYFLLTFTMYHSGNVQKTCAYLEKLERAVMEAQGGCQHFRALNLLGYCYLRIGRFDSAYKRFTESMKQTVGYYQNAAIYHIIILIFKIIEMGVHDTIL
ncbi:Hypothetical predicted protein [Mytilus galloprovincialis]|uniref:Cyclic GMP-AMP synthase n=1 Tax=Mytilus galloprovincialis TaxID=29158 RepID=A0A8B6HE33_MYTGA|nr:Hypothetical predicted protein [Mytilus galloprovincialis]